MKALFCPNYGTPGVLCIKEIEVPIPADDEVLVKVYSTTVNRTDLGILAGTPYILRLFTGLFRPRLKITGTDFAGQIEAVGKQVSSFKVGDRVMGFGGIGLQSHAQLLAVKENLAIVGVPANINFDEAAACMEAPFYAQDNVNKLAPKAGQKALVIGGTGAIGSSMVQILKFYGVDVSAVCGLEHSDLVRSLGADRIFDYKNDDYTREIDRYDFVFDAVGKSSFPKCKPILRQHGIYTSTDGFINIFFALITAMSGRKKVVFTPPKSLKTGINFIKGLVEQGKFRPLIDRRYPFDEIVKAYEYVGTGKKIGSVVIAVHEDKC